MIEPQKDAPIVYPPLVILAMTLIAFLFCGLIGGGIAWVIASAQGVEMIELLGGLNENSSLATRNLIRFITGVNHFSTFFLPVLLIGLTLYRKRMAAWLKLDSVPLLTNILIGSFLMISAFPLVQFSLWLNQQLPLPSWMIVMEDSTNDMIQGLLKMESPVELLFNLLIIAVLPGIGEELLFRGVIQQNMRKWLKNPHVAIWLTAIIFSAIHLQFQGFLPRMLLGALLGYLFFWTNNLWIPIIAHFVTNGFQVLGAYFVGDMIKTMDATEVEPNWIATGISVVLVGVIVQYFIKVYQNRQNV